MNKIDKIKQVVAKNPNNSRKFIKEIKLDDVLWEWVLKETSCHDNIKNDIERIYILLHGRNKECIYGNNIHFKSYSVGYVFCGRANECKCVKEHVAITVTKTKNEYTVEQKQQIKQKRENTNMNKFGVKNPYSNKNIQEKIKQTNIDKYGVETPLKNEVIRSKMEQTHLERYGVKNPMQLNENKSKITQTNLDRYGVEHCMHLPKTIDKIKKTNQQRYGKENHMHVDDIKNKIKNTNLERYGVENVFLKSAVQDEIKQKKKVVFFNNLSERVNSLYTPMFDQQDYMGVGPNKNSIKYEWKCNSCDNAFMDNIINGSIPRCSTCYPHNQSKWELEIQEYIRQYVNIETNTKQIISPYELDIYIPNKNVAIECNGSYWHSENNGKDGTYHLNKTDLCEEQNIQLLHIWEHEYLDNPELIKSLIKSKLDLDEKIDIVKTTIQVIDEKTKNVFLVNNHIQGMCLSKINLGLYYENELVALMAFDNTKDKTEYEYELIRYCSKQNINVIGGASKLFKYFIKTYNPNNIISYVDRRYSTGNVYKQLNFGFVENNSPNFKYTKNYKTMYNKLQFQKHELNEKLDVFDDTLTDDQNMINNGYDKLWDCGNSVWVYTNKGK